MDPRIEKSFASASRWREEGMELRRILKESPLEEGFKWGKPCYAHQGANVAIVQRMKAHLALMFFKGVLLEDPEGLLHAPGPNARVGRRFEWTSIDELRAMEPTIRAYIDEAIALEERGATVELDDEELELVAELEEALEQDEALRAAFDELTPGRQRHYNLHIGGAKQEATRRRRVEQARPRILAGKGLRD